MEYDYYPEEEPKKKSPVLAVLKYAVIALVIVVYALMIFRIAIKEDPKSAKEFIWTESSVAAYNESSGEFRVQNQQIRSFSYIDPVTGEATKLVYNTITDDGYFQISSFMYVEATKELILTFRYNNASLEFLKQEYGLSQLPEGELYYLALNTSKGRVTEYTYTSSARFTYEYRRVIFENVDLSQEKTLDLDIYFMGDIDLDRPLASLTVYDYRIPVEYYDLKDALPAKINEGLKKSPYVPDGE